jgi:hypothetical protein
LEKHNHFDSGTVLPKPTRSSNSIVHGRGCRKEASRVTEMLLYDFGLSKSKSLKYSILGDIFVLEKHHGKKNTYGSDQLVDLLELSDGLLSLGHIIIIDIEAFGVLIITVDGTDATVSLLGEDFGNGLSLTNINSADLN